MRKLVAFCLLIAFGVLLSPRDFWHECDDHYSHELSHSHDDNNSDSSHEVHFEKQCFACDYDMDASESPLSFAYRFLKPTYFISADEVTIGVNSNFSDCSTLRGPPNA